MSVEQQIAQHAVELGRQDAEAERHEEIRQELIQKYTKKIRLLIAIRDLQSIHNIFDEHNRCLHAWIAEQMIDIYSLHAHSVYEKILLGKGRDKCADIALKMASVLDYRQEIQQQMNCDSIEI